VMGQGNHSTCVNIIVDSSWGTNFKASWLQAGRHFSWPSGQSHWMDTDTIGVLR
jgi:hypothetical protein